MELPLLNIGHLQLLIKHTLVHFPEVCRKVALSSSGERVDQFCCPGIVAHSELHVRVLNLLLSQVLTVLELWLLLELEL